MCNQYKSQINLCVHGKDYKVYETGEKSSSS